MIWCIRFSCHISFDRIDSIKVANGEVLHFTFFSKNKKLTLSSICKLLKTHRYSDRIYTEEIANPYLLTTHHIAAQTHTNDLLLQPVRGLITCSVLPSSSAALHLTWRRHTQRRTDRSSVKRKNADGFSAGVCNTSVGGWEEDTWGGNSFTCGSVYVCVETPYSTL